jgi:hypothetical protein
MAGWAAFIVMIIDVRVGKKATEAGSRKWCWKWIRIHERMRINGSGSVSA